MSSTVTPSESVSTSGDKKRKPGKRERAAARSLTGSAGGQPASRDKAAMFAAGSSDPVPTPGRYPIVFQTGAGEPTRDQEFVPSPATLIPLVSGFPSRFTKHPSYAQFRSDAEIADAAFGTQLSVAFLLRLAQQLVHAHVNMGLPQGDFGSVATSDVRVPTSMSTIVSQFGEFPSPSIGTRFLLRGYEDTVAHFVHTANRIWNNGGPVQNLQRLWLPLSAHDEYTKAVVGSALTRFLANADLAVLPSVLEDAVLSGDVPDAWEAVKGVLGTHGDRFDFLFKSYADAGTLTTAFTTDRATAALAELDLQWPSPSAGQLDWSFNAKTTFSSLAEKWAKLSAAYARFFEMSTGLASRQSARGSHAQMVQVTATEGVTIVKTMVALTAGEFSLAACFPPTGLFVGDLVRRVVVTTPLAIDLRATEYCQNDWR